MGEAAIKLDSFRELRRLEAHFFTEKTVEAAKHFEKAFLGLDHAKPTAERYDHLKLDLSDPRYQIAAVLCQFAYAPESVSEEMHATIEGWAEKAMTNEVVVDEMSMLADAYTEALDLIKETAGPLDGPRKPGSGGFPPPPPGP